MEKIIIWLREKLFFHSVLGSTLGLRRCNHHCAHTHTGISPIRNWNRNSNKKWWLWRFSKKEYACAIHVLVFSAVDSTQTKNRMPFEILLSSHQITYRRRWLQSVSATKKSAISKTTRLLEKTVPAYGCTLQKRCLHRMCNTHTETERMQLES